MRPSTIAISVWGAYGRAKYGRMHPPYVRYGYLGGVPAFLAFGPWANARVA